MHASHGPKLGSVIVGCDLRDLVRINKRLRGGSSTTERGSITPINLDSCAKLKNMCVGSTEVDELSMIPIKCCGYSRSRCSHNMGFIRLYKHSADQRVLQLVFLNLKNCATLVTNLQFPETSDGICQTN